MAEDQRWIACSASWPIQRFRFGQRVQIKGESTALLVVGMIYNLTGSPIDWWYGVIEEGVQDAPLAITQENQLAEYDDAEDPKEGA